MQNSKHCLTSRGAKKTARKQIRKDLSEWPSVALVRRSAEDWIYYGRIRQFSAYTLKDRAALCRRLLVWLEEQGKGEVGPAELMEFFGSLGRSPLALPRKGKTPLRASTLVGYHINLCSLFNWMVKEEIIERSPMERVPRPHKPKDAPHLMENDQFLRLLEEAKRHPGRKRNAAILLLLMDSGLRVSELCGLDVCDVDFVINRARVRGKGNKYRYVYFGNRTARALQQYLKDHPSHAEKRDWGTLAEPLFISESGRTSGERLGRMGIAQMMTKLARGCGLSGVRVSAHTLRHSFATQFIRNEGNQQALQEILGHTSPQMTQRYVTLANADIRAEHRRASPVDRMGS